MGEFRVTANGVPFTVRGVETRDEARQALAQRIMDTDGAVIIEKAERLGLNQEDLEALGTGKIQAPETTTSERVLIGAGRELAGAVRGIEQLLTRETPQTAPRLRQLERDEENERETFALLDDLGIGAEDVGQILPNALAFVGTGGGSTAAQAASLAARGTALGLTRPLVGGENRAQQALTEGALSAVVPGAGRALGIAANTARSAPGVVARSLSAGALDALFTGGLATGSLAASGVARAARKGIFQTLRDLAKGGAPEGIGMAHNILNHIMNPKILKDAFPLFAAIGKASKEPVKDALIKNVTRRVTAAGLATGED